MTPICLTDAELAEVMAAARPLAPHVRNAFLEAVASELGRLGGEAGLGTVHRVCRQLQRQFFDPPDLSGAA
jgi:hypothetical protein